jgi:iron(III) transport system ATP-binding protein
VTGGVTKEFGAVTAVDAVDLEMQPGEFVTLLGPSGCGKSTLLRMIAGIEPPTTGTIEISGRVVNDVAARVAVPPEKRKLGMVFQSYAIWPHMSVYKNVEYPLRYAGVARNLRSERVHDALASCDMAEYSERYPHELSGGQQQRVALARAIVAQPALLLLDEPLSNLDARLREQMRLELKRLHVELGLTMLYVTHDQSEALAMSDRILVMDRGQILQEGSPEEVYRNPHSITVARFLGVKNIIRGTLVDSTHARLGPHVVPVTARGDVSVDDPVVLAIRPDAITRPRPGSNAAGELQGRIRVVEFLGTEYEHEIVVGDDVALIVTAPDRLGDMGDLIELSVNPDGANAFPDRGDDSERGDVE